MTRPTSVTVFGIINICLGLLGVLGFAWYLITKLELVELPESQQNAAMRLMQENAQFQLYNDVTTIIGFLAAILIIAASIGMFQLRPWARMVTIAWGVYGVLMTIIGTVLTHVMIMRPLLAEMSSGPERVGIMAGLIAGYVFAALSIGYCVLMMAMLNRAKVREAFEGHDETMEPAA